jgi:hypothetical protein
VGKTALDYSEGLEMMRSLVSGSQDRIGGNTSAILPRVERSDVRKKVDAALRYSRTPGHTGIFKAGVRISLLVAACDVKMGQAPRKRARTGRRGILSSGAECC